MREERYAGKMNQELKTWGIGYFFKVIVLKTTSQKINDILKRDNYY